MRRSELLITQIRRATENTDFSESTGISDEEFLQYLNDAQDRLYSLISSSFPKTFTAEIETTLAASQESVSLPANLYNNSRIENVEFTTGSSENYYPLAAGVSYDRVNGTPANPSFYIRRGTSILLQPANASAGAKIRIEYQRNIQRLDKRRAQITAVTLDTATLTVTTLTVDTTVLLTPDDITAIQDAEYATFVDRNGTIQMSKLPVESIDSSTGVVTLFSGFVYEAGETLTVGDYMCMGYLSSTHSELPDTCERYLIASSQNRVLGRDSSSDSAEMRVIEEKMEMDILSAFQKPDNDVHTPPVDDDQFLDFY